MDACGSPYSFSIGHERIDADHKRMLDAVNRLMRVADSGVGRMACDREFDNLIALTWEHFAFEERLMVLHQDPNIGSHQKEHAKLIDELIILKAHFDDGSMSIPESLKNALHRWLLRHINDCDRPLADFIKLLDNGTPTTQSLDSPWG